MEKDSFQYKITQNNLSNSGSASNGTDIVIRDFQIITDHYLQIPEHPLLSTHTEILTDKNNLLSRYGLQASEIGSGTKGLSANDTKDLCQSLNQLAVSFQDALKAKIGRDAYIELNGNDRFYQPVNPEIAVKALDDLSIYQK